MIKKAKAIIALKKFNFKEKEWEYIFISLLNPFAKPLLIPVKDGVDVSTIKQILVVWKNYSGRGTHLTLI